jgi:rhodanese-related sulfurtransferase
MIAMAGFAQTVVENVTLDELQKGLADGSILLVDVREANEWAAARIPGAFFNPLSAFDPKALPKQDGKRVVLHCRSGKRSVTALGLAQAGGRADVRAHFGGGMLEWVASGCTVEQG